MTMIGRSEVSVVIIYDVNQRLSSPRSGANGRRKEWRLLDEGLGVVSMIHSSTNRIFVES
jgi:hypothetical protein